MATNTGYQNPYNQDFYKKMKSAYYGATTPGITQNLEEMNPQIKAQLVKAGSGLTGTPYAGTLGKEYGKLESQRQAGWQSTLGNLMGRQAGYEEEAPWRHAQTYGYGPGFQSSIQGGGAANNAARANEEQKAINRGESLATPTLARQQWETSQSGYLPGGQSTFGREAYEKEFPMKEAQYTGSYGGAPTSQYAQQMMPWITQGYLPKDMLGEGYGGVQTERELSPEWQTARGIGTENPFLTGLLGETDPDELKQRIRDYLNKSGGGSVNI